MPRAQESQPLAPEALYLLAGQIVHAELLEAENVPAAHVVHVVAPETLLKVPA